MDLSGVRRDVVVPVRTDPLGIAGPTRRQAATAAWRRSSKGRYVPADVDRERVHQRIVEAAATLPDDRGGVTGWAGLAWDDARWFGGAPWGGGRARPIVLATGGSRAIRAQPAYGIATSEERLDPVDLVLLDGVRITSHVRSVWFEMRYADSLVDAVTTLDMAAYDDLVSIAELVAFAGLHRGWTGAPQCRAAAALADENAWSPREVAMRIVWSVHAGLPRPLCNRPVFDHRGRHLGTPDLLDPVAGVLGQYDGGLHLTSRARHVDVALDDVYRSHGLECVTMLAGDHPDHAPFIARLRGAYERAADIPSSRRRWTIEPPPRWQDTSTVAARRALTPGQRRRLLGYRAA